jgi:hypothetical protein
MLRFILYITIFCTSVFACSTENIQAGAAPATTPSPAPSATPRPFTVVDRSPLVFAQITDIHLFDAGKKSPSREEALKELEENWNSFRWSIATINHLVEDGSGIQFVVFTGDFGLELVRKSAQDLPCGQPNPKAFADIQTQGWPELLTTSRAASQVAAQFRLLKVKAIYLVPGNNDLVEEMPCDLDRYRDFVKQVAAGMSASGPRVVDLINPGPNDVLQYGPFRLVGLNSASFKDDRNCARSPPAAGCPEPEMQQLQQNTASKNLHLIFTHVPDLIDPWNVQKDPATCIPGISKIQCDAWKNFSATARKTWTAIAQDPRTIIFAGHFHSDKRLYYGTAASETDLWIDRAIAAKTWVTPPLAIKNQEKAQERARGLSLIRVQQQLSGTAVDVSVIPFWYSEYRNCFAPVYLLYGLGALVTAAVIFFGWRKISLEREIHGSWNPGVFRPAPLTLVLLLVISGLAWVLMEYLTSQLHLDWGYGLVPVFGALGGAVGAFRTSGKWVFSSLEPSHLEVGTLREVFLGIGGAVAALGVFGGTLSIDLSKENSIIVLISISFVAGAFGAIILQTAGERVIRQLVREEVETKTKEAVRSALEETGKGGEPGKNKFADNNSGEDK